LAPSKWNVSPVWPGRYDIISWDPRGVNLTSPTIGCFPNEASAQLFQRDVEAIGLLYENTPSSLSSNPASKVAEQELAWVRKLDGFNLALDQTCVERGDREMLEHQTTAATARDMKLLMGALGETRLNYWGFR
jgi:pimeloyl-ACP methyl ester carboxylesterase